MMMQVIKYKCCGKVFAACREPECYTDKDWHKTLRKYVPQGHKVEMMEKVVFGECTCGKLNFSNL
jgi:hypothetical protein